jgi:hypothetical protein
MKKEKSSSVIIARQEHGISRKLMNPNALRTLYRLRDNGFVGYLVGGWEIFRGHNEIKQVNCIVSPVNIQLGACSLINHLTTG